MATKTEIKVRGRLTPYAAKKSAVPEKNSGEIIVRQNLTVKIRELMENWTTNPPKIDTNV